MLSLICVALLLVSAAAGFDCPGDAGIYPDPDDCNSFYDCTHYFMGKFMPFHKTCAEGTAFNAQDEVCDWPTNVDCSGRPLKSPLREYKDQKCWRNPMPQHLTLLEGTDDRLDGQYQKRENAVEKCHQVSSEGDYDYFAVGNRGQCWAGFGDSYMDYGTALQCPSNGKGKYAVVNIYQYNFEPAVGPTTPEPTFACGETFCRTRSEYCSSVHLDFSQLFQRKCHAKQAKGGSCGLHDHCFSNKCEFGFLTLGMVCQ